MDEYIKKQTALKMLCKDCTIPHEDEVCEYRFEGCKEYYSIYSLPAEDVRENVLGYWIAEGYNHWHCSNCKYVAGVIRIDCSFCPNCGADMRGERDA